MLFPLTKTFLLVQTLVLHFATSFFYFLYSYRKPSRYIFTGFLSSTLFRLLYHYAVMIQSCGAPVPEKNQTFNMPGIFFQNSSTLGLASHRHINNCFILVLYKQRELVTQSVLTWCLATLHDNADSVTYSDNYQHIVL